MSKAQVAAMIAEVASEREKEQAEKDAFKQDLISGLKGMIDSQIASVLSTNGAAKKALQRAGANVGSASSDKANTAMLAEAGTASTREQDAAAERCAESLMSKFNAKGSKAGKKSG